MEYFGLMSFFFVLLYIGLPTKVKRLESDNRKLKNLIKGDTAMSKMLKELEGTTCKMTIENGLNAVVNCEVICVDDDWMKIEEISKKGARKPRIIRIDNIVEINPN